MTDRERKAIDDRLAAIVAAIFPDAIDRGGPAFRAYGLLVKLRADLAASEEYGVAAIESGRNSD